MTEPTASLLLIEDDADLRAFLSDNLAADGFEVHTAETAGEGLRRLEAGRPDLALIDVALPDGSGLDVLREMRGADGLASRLDPGTPVIVLSGRASELDRVRGFDLGCDDYVAKPFSYPELRSRVSALLRRTRTRPGRGRLRVGALEIDPASREVLLGGERIDLSAKEFALLRALATEPTRVFTKEELLRDVWGFKAMGQTRTLDSHACRLRHKLGVHGHRFVFNVWGVGYRLVDGVPA